VRRYDAVLLDAYGTLVELDDPFGRLRASLRRHLGADVSHEDARRAFLAEMAYYTDHCHTGADAESLRVLYRDCAAILLRELGIEDDPERAAGTLAEAIRFRVFADVRPALAGLAEAGVATAVVSNWDHTLARVLEEAGLEFDVVVDSATARSVKPDPGIFRTATDRLGVDPARTLHVGDTPATDAAGARAAGVDVRIVDRGGVGGRDTIVSLTDILPLVA
jgi:2-haloalkanoic acid dehalogenase type II